MATVLTLSFTDNEIAISEAEMFNAVAAHFNVEVGQRGRKPKAELARAILAHPDGYKIVDTDYFNAAMAEDRPTGGGYKPKGQVFETAEDLLAAVESLTFPLSVRAVKSSDAPSNSDSAAQSVKSGVHEVSARLPLVKDGDVALTKNGAVRHLPGTKTERLTNAEVRALADAGQRGRLSESQIVLAFAQKVLPHTVVEAWSDKLGELLANVQVTTNVETAEAA